MSPVCGAAISRVAAMPSSTGIRMSMSTTSGRRAGDRVDCLDDRREASPRDIDTAGLQHHVQAERIRSWSSAITTLGSSVLNTGGGEKT